MTALWNRAGYQRAPRSSRAGRLWRIVEKERERWFLWVPILLGAGITLYFSWPTEPEGTVYGIAFAILVLCLPGLRARRWIFLAAVSGIAISAGFLAAGYRAVRMQAPVLEAPMKGVEVEGMIVSLERQGPQKGARWILEPSRIENLPRDTLPRRIRLRSHTMPDHFAPGDLVWARALLNPPPGPVEPEAYNFARRLWFEQNGATGVTFGPPYPRTRRKETRRDITIAVEALRTAITQRIQAILEGSPGGVAAAVITGHRAGIPRTAETALRDSGLAHILAISGLHVALVSGLLFWLVRWSLLRVPFLALRLPVRKWAAGTALAGSLFYLVISGASIATQRACIMIAVMTIAVMLDRPALTLRNVAIAAIIILLVQPDSLLGASFQMSFAATMALVAVYEGRGERMQSWLSSKNAGFIRRGVQYVLALSLTSLVAGTATGFLAAYHFNRFAVYGLVANLLAVPLLGAVVMPLALLSVVLMPLGLETWPLYGAGLAIDTILQLGERVASWPGAVRHMPSGAPWTLGLLAIGGCWLCLWRQPWRWWGVFPIILAVLLPTYETRPDILVDRDGRTIGLLHDGFRYSARPRRAKYSVNIWRRRDGVLSGSSSSSPWQCTPEECMALLPDGRLVALAETLPSLERNCRQADIVVTAVSFDGPCPSAALFINRQDLRLHGSHAVYLKGNRLHLHTTSEVTGQRPWALYRQRTTLNLVNPANSGNAANAVNTASSD